MCCNRYRDGPAVGMTDDNDTRRASMRCIPDLADRLIEDFGVAKHSHFRWVDGCAGTVARSIMCDDRNA